MRGGLEEAISKLEKIEADNILKPLRHGAGGEKEGAEENLCAMGANEEGRGNEEND